jgi:predicted ATP-grasp superfamily ATP-dependent carboligase
VSSRASVLVTDGEERAALAAVRSLGRAGYRVYVCAARDRSLAAASRYCAGTATTPSPLREPDRYRETVASLVHRRSIDVLLPVSEQALRVLLPARFEERGVRVPFPSHDAFARISDKGELLRGCARFGLVAPDQQTLTAPSQLDAVEAALAFPVVVKPTRSVVYGPTGALKTGVAYAGSVDELRHRLAALPEAAYPVLLQQRIVGPGSGVFLLVWDGELVATFAHRRLREKPPAGGVSVYSESVAADPTLVERGLRLLREFGWQGVAMLEFKTDGATGQAYLMEINGRLWGSLQLAIDAGVDFPALLVGCALGDKPAAPAYRIGLRNRWWWGDVDHLLTRLRRSPTELGLPPDAPSRWRVVRDFLRLWRPDDRNEVLRLTDPRPFVRETLDWLRPRV